MGFLSSITRPLSSFFHPERGYQKGQEQLDKYYNQTSQLYQPYINQGQEAYGHVNTAMQNLLNPAQFRDEMLSQYQPSESARLRAETAQNSGLDAASSMGLMGSTPALQAIQSGTNNILANDELSYLQQLFDMYGTGAKMAQDIYGTGANAAHALGQNTMQMGENSAQMAFGKQNAPGEMFNNLLQALIYQGRQGGGSPGAQGGGSGWSTSGGGR